MDEMRQQHPEYSRARDWASGVESRLGRSQFSTLGARPDSAQGGADRRVCPGDNLHAGRGELSLLRGQLKGRVGLKHRQDFFGKELEAAIELRSR